MRNKTANRKSQIANLERGATTILVAIFVLNIIMMMALTGASLMVFQIKMSQEIANSVPAFMAADAAAEKCLYEAMKIAGNCQNIGGSATVILSNGATATATRIDGSTIESLGGFQSTNRKIRITGIVGGLSVTAISPSSGVTNTTVSNITITGTGFLNGATALLRRNGHGDILPSTAFVFSGEASLTGGAFNLSGANPGNWDVVVDNPNGKSAFLDKGFEVDQH